MTPEESLEEINRGLQNYRKLPLATDVLRRWPIMGPFISFKWNMAKIIGNQATQAVEELASPRTRGAGIGRLLRIAAVLATPTILSEVSKVVYDVDEEKIKQLEAFYPSYRRNGTFVYFRDGSGNLSVFDMSRIWPTGDLERWVRAILKGDVTGVKDAMDLMSSPLFDAIDIVVKGKDPQFGTDIRHGRGLLGDAWDTALYMFQYTYMPASMPIPSLQGLAKGGNFGPAMIAGPDGKPVPNPEGGNIRPGAFTGQQFRAIIDAYNKAPDKYGTYKDLPEEIKNFFTGIRTWNVEPEKLLAQAAIAKRAQVMDAQSDLRSWISRNLSAPEWEKKQHIDQFNKIVEPLKRDLATIGDLIEEARKGKLAFRKRQ